ncbi:hypothetical protein [Pseudobacteriovorax antillogorgiicola]|uniref:Uncharacterized protein n=1 Tax=Pseudobacteriovorax antillogorgiicola TaxID=1513793 RepID=A0A1Y6BQ96_9BACT|nr:hypothetical protein [Pseudobacteriovorax antillogorgiicola]TCS53755.1 hypothetical protein EDD56_10764 [Pseudobacteriovorax antillogorgiicola]SMF22559.1 hypothetical protein SAMN06296036_107208 [Pseudobacteriovorax antillogorgiicola]
MQRFTDKTHTAPSNVLSLRSEGGATLIETMLSVVLLIASFYWGSQSIVNNMKARRVAQAADLVYESDQMIRYEAELFWENLQRRITEFPTSEQCKGNNLFEIVREIRKARSHAQSYMYLGNYIDLESEYNEPDKVDTIQATKVFESHESFWAEVQAKQGSSNPAKKILQVFERCKYPSIVQNVDRSTRNSLYQCALLENAIVEMKGTFWDFNRGIPIECNKQNEFSGRGLQVVYAVHRFSEAASTENNLGYSLSKSDGRLYISKAVKGLTLEGP